MKSCGTFGSPPAPPRAADTGEFVPRWSTALSRLRTARHFLWLALEVAFGPRQPIVVISTPILDKEVTHPSQLCQCPCGYDAPAVEHLEACEWRKRMCGACGGSGHCGGCGGDGTRPEGVSP